MNFRYTCTFILTVLISALSFAQKGYKIDVFIDGYEEKQLILGYQYGDKQYIKDTVNVNADGHFIFEGEEALDEGMYLLVMMPNNNFIQFMADPTNQYFSYTTKHDELVRASSFTDSPLNNAYYDYLRYLETKVPEKTKYETAYKEAGDDKVKADEALKKIQAINEEVRKKHVELAKINAPNLLSRLLQTRLDPVIPEFTGDDIEFQRYLYYKRHYFDNIDIGDEGLLRTGALFQKVNYYVNKLTEQRPDSLNHALDYILKQSEGSNNFKFFLIHYLNTYAGSNIVGMDAVYVHLVESYYATGKADWTDGEQLKKIVDNAKTLKPILIVKTAPNLVLRKRNNESVAIHSIDSDYTVLLFWDPDCGHCKKSMPDVLAFHEKYRSKGVEVLGICTKVGEEAEMKKCWDTIEEKKMGNWINVTDQYLRSNYKDIYNIKSTPRIFILDKDKKIVSKGIGAEQLDEVMDQIIRQEQEELMQKSE